MGRDSVSTHEYYLLLLEQEDGMSTCHKGITPNSNSTIGGFGDYT